MTSCDILCYAMKTLRCCSIVMHIHDELVIEANPRMSLEAVCEQMGRTPLWAKGLLLRADGYDAIADEILRLRDMRKQAEVDSVVRDEQMRLIRDL